jgi:hypothetical protein
MTDEQRAELKRLAEAVPFKDGVAVQASGEDAEHVKAVGDFIAAAKPAAVLDLLKEHERLRSALTEVSESETISYARRVAAEALTEDDR